MAIRGLQKELTCSLCLEIFKEPRQLPCLHIYCTACVSSLLKGARTRTFDCPQCRQQVQIPGAGVEGFPKVFKVASLLAIYEEMLAVRETAMCKVHPTQELAMFCEGCNTVLCRDCYINTKCREGGGGGRGHWKGYITEIAPSLRAELVMQVVEAKEVEGLTDALRSSELALEQVARCHEGLIQGVEERFAALTRSLQKEKIGTNRQRNGQKERHTGHTHREALKAKQRSTRCYCLGESCM